MLVGVPKEIKTHEYRVGLAPGSVREIVHNGHEVIVETRAGAGIGFDDDKVDSVGSCFGFVVDLGTWARAAESLRGNSRRGCGVAVICARTRWRHGVCSGQP